MAEPLRKAPSPRPPQGRRTTAVPRPFRQRGAHGALGTQISEMGSGSPMRGCRRKQSNFDCLKAFTKTEGSIGEGSPSDGRAPTSFSAAATATPKQQGSRPLGSCVLCCAAPRMRVCACVRACACVCALCVSSVCCVCCARVRVRRACACVLRVCGSCVCAVCVRVRVCAKGCVSKPV